MLHLNNILKKELLLKKGESTCAKFVEAYLSTAACKGHRGMLEQKEGLIRMSQWKSERAINECERHIKRAILESTNKPVSAFEFYMFSYNKH